ncbi:uncharacterized protein BO88DRAFT_297857, partial [Aspergillus vadensis CBS 113365]
SSTNIPVARLASTPCVANSPVGYGEEDYMVHVTSTKGRSTPNRILGGYYVRKARRIPLLGLSVAVPALDRWSIKFFILWRCKHSFEKGWELPASHSATLPHRSTFPRDLARCKTTVGRQMFIAHTIGQNTARQDAET